MPKKSHSLSVTLSPFTRQSGLKSPLSPTIMSSSKAHPSVKPEGDGVGKTTDLRPSGGGGNGDHVAASGLIPHSARHPAPPPLPSPPIAAKLPERERERGRAFLGSSQRSRSATRLHPHDATIRPVSNGDAADPDPEPEDPLYALARARASSPDVTLTEGLQLLEAEPSSVTLVEDTSSTTALDSPFRAGSHPAAAPGKGATKKLKPKPRPFAHLLGRSRSNRTDLTEPAPKSTGYHRSAGPDHLPQRVEDPALKTAPLHHDGDRSFRDMVTSSIRNRSADRQRPAGSEDGSITSKENGKHFTSFSSSFKDGGGAAFFSNLKSSSTRAADGLGKAGKGIFGKLTRSGSSGEKEVVSDENYVCSVITLPLVEQTRRTRISKRLEDSRDKTEFWMPALPWRCIDYLNYKGCEVEGLYRVPGSGYQVKQWQRRFDTELDINLFDEPDLYDINIIGSMFKAWLRELPDELFPKATQARIAEKCMGAKEVPQMLKDELSKLQPYNYYLLFAITCHLSLLHTHVEQNKMDYRNLCICFQPCLKMDGFCFQFLVCEWKHCWQGCWTEKEALAEEYRVMSIVPPSSAGASTAGSREYNDERAVSSSGSSNPPSLKPMPEMAESAHPAPVAPAEVEKESIRSSDVPPEPSAVPPTPTRETPPPKSPTQKKPPLSPLTPLSPLQM